MDRTELKKFVGDYLAAKVRKDARIELTEYKSGITVCVCTPSFPSGGAAKYVEWSIPAIITVYCIQSTNAIMARLDRYLSFYDYMLAA